MEKAGPQHAEDRVKWGKSGNGLSFSCWNLPLPRQQNSDRAGRWQRGRGKGQPCSGVFSPLNSTRRLKCSFLGHCSLSLKAPLEPAVLLQPRWALQTVACGSCHSFHPQLPKPQSQHLRACLLWLTQSITNLSLISLGFLPLSLVHCLFQHSENCWSLYQTPQFLISQVFTFEQLDAPVCWTGKNHQASCHKLCCAGVPGGLVVVFFSYWNGILKSIFPDLKQHWHPFHTPPTLPSSVSG